MKTPPEKLAEQIKKLINELVETTLKQRTKQSKQEKVPKGVIGAITMLINDGFFDTPQTRATIIEKLKAVGHYDKPETVSMTLLNLAKRRKLNRFKNKKQWEYVIRK